MDEDSFDVIDEAMALYKGSSPKNRDALRAILLDLNKWASERGFSVRDELDAVLPETP